MPEAKQTKDAAVLEEKQDPIMSSVNTFTGRHGQPIVRECSYSSSSYILIPHLVHQVPSHGLTQAVRRVSHRGERPQHVAGRRGVQPPPLLAAATPRPYPGTPGTPGTQRAPRRPLRLEAFGQSADQAGELLGGGICVADKRGESPQDLPNTGGKEGWRGDGRRCAACLRGPSDGDFTSPFGRRKRVKAGIDASHLGCFDVIALEHCRACFLRHRHRPISPGSESLPENGTNSLAIFDPAICASLPSNASNFGGIARARFEGSPGAVNSCFQLLEYDQWRV